MAEDQNIQISADVGSAISEIEAIARAFDKESTSLNRNLSVMAKWNTIGEAQEITLKGLTESGKVFETTYAKMDGVFKRTSSSIGQATRAMVALNAQQSKLKQTGSRQQEFVKLQVRKLADENLGLPPEGAAGEARRRYNAALNNLAKLSVGRNIQNPTDTFTKGLKDAENGVRDYSNTFEGRLSRAIATVKERYDSLTQSAARAQEKIKKADEEAKRTLKDSDAQRAADLTAKRQEAAAKGQGTKLFNVLKGNSQFNEQQLSQLTGNQVGQLTKEYNRIASLIAQQKITAKRASEIQRSVQKGEAVRFESKGEESAFATYQRILAFESRLKNSINQSNLALQKRDEIFKRQQDKINTKAINTRSGEEFVSTLPSAFGTPKGNATPEELNRVLRATNAIQQSIRSGNIPINNFKTALAGIKAGVTDFNNIDTRKAAVQLNSLQQAINNAGDTIPQKATKVLLSWTSLIRIFAVQVIHTGIGNLIYSLRESVNAASEFSIKVGELRTLSQDNQLSTQQWSSALADLSSKFNAPLLDVTKAAYETLSNQIGHGAEAVSFLNDALKFGATTQTSATDSVNTLSTAINAYSQTAADARRISDIFFRTIDRGRITGQELDLTLGRTLPLASQLGVSLEEVSSSFVVLTRQGVQAHEASTQLNAIFAALLKPTPALASLMREWGTYTGQASIATFGFVGVLQRLQDELGKNGLERLGEIAPNIRAIKGIVGTSNLDTFRDELNQVTKSASAVNGAFKLIEETSGQKFQRQQKNIINFFTTDVGQGIIDKITGITDKFGGLDVAVKNIVNAFGALPSPILASVSAFGSLTSTFGSFLPTLQTVGALLGAYFTNKYLIAPVIARTVTIFTALSSAVSTFNGHVAQGLPRLAALKASFSGLGTLAASLKAGLIGIGLALLTLGVSTLINDYNRASREIVNIGEQTEQELLNISNKRTKSYQDLLAREINDFKSKEKEKTRSVLLEEANRNKSAQKLLEEPNKALKLSSKYSQFTPEFKALLKPQQLETEKLFDTTLDHIIGSQKALQDLQDRYSQSSFDRALQGRNAAQQAELTLRRISQLRTEGVKLFDTDNIEEARAKFDKIEGLLDGLIEKQNANRAQGRALGVVFTNPSLQEKYYGNGPNNIYKQRIQLEADYQKKKQEQAVQLNQIHNKEVENNKVLDETVEKAQAASKAFGDIAASTAKIGGNLKTLNTLINVIDKPLINSYFGSGEFRISSREQAAATSRAQKTQSIAQKSFESFNLSQEKSEDPHIQRQKLKVVESDFENFIDAITKSAQLKFGEKDTSKIPTGTGQSLQVLINEARTNLQQGKDFLKAFDSSTHDLKESGFNTDVFKLQTEQLQAIQNNTNAINNNTKAQGGEITIPTNTESKGTYNNGNNHFASGGLPQGVDTQMIWKDPREFIMNATASRKFYSQLSAMNAGVASQNTTNGPVTNVGDIHLHVHGSSNSDETVRTLGRKLRRELKRGSVVFN